MSLPSFFTGLIILVYVCITWQIMPVPGYVPITEDPAGWAKNLILPWITLAILFAALYTRLTRASMIETMGEDYIRTARAKGLNERTVIFKHGLRAALTPIITIAGLDLGGLLGGAVITETVFGWNGMGQFLLRSIASFDRNAVLGWLMVSGFIVVLGNLVADLLYGVLDPRIRHE